MSLVSYAQNFEDVMLWRVLHHVQQGFYIDVGAQSPDHDSVSRMFYEHGWRGVHVEPTDAYASQLRARRPDEIVLQVAVTDQSGDLRFFDIADTGLSTADEQIARDHRQNGFEVREITVPGMPLSEVFEKAGTDQVHWLKIDVEGVESQVIGSWGDSPVRPWVLVIESTRPLSTDLSYQAWEAEVLALGYTFAYFDGLNRFYVSQQHPELLSGFSCGPNVFDDFVFGPDSNFCVAARDHWKAEADARVTQLQAEHESERQEHQARIEAVLTEQSQVIELLQADIDEARAIAEVHRAEAIRQAMGAQLAGAALAEIEQSTSWRMTAPLRHSLIAARRILRSPKDIVRHGLVRAMRPVSRSPGCWRIANAAVRLVPQLHFRLRSLAASQGLVVASSAAVERGGEPGALGQVGSFSATEGRPADALSARGKIILERIQKARKGLRE